MPTNIRAHVTIDTLAFPGAIVRFLKIWYHPNGDLGGFNEFRKDTTNTTGHTPWFDVQAYGLNEGHEIAIKAEGWIGGQYVTNQVQFYITADHTYAIPLFTEGYVPPIVIEDGIKQAKWEAQPWQDRLAYSFIISLAIILTFKMLQGFSMERINPVA